MRAYRPLFDQVLTRVDAETAHHIGFAAVRTGQRLGRLAPAGLGRTPQGQANGASAVSAMGLTFPGPLGVAAGFDKNAIGIDALVGLGFSFVEVGTVTAVPQPGNPRPRLFRLPEDRAVVNRMGFNNDGAATVAVRLRQRALRLQQQDDGTGRRRQRGPVVGVNIGKSKIVPETDLGAVIADYETSTRLLAPYADYLVVNVSSPNTPGLRSLQAVNVLRPLLTAVSKQADATTGRHVPLLVKIAPDLADADVEAVADLATELALDGVVATNTTVRREGLRSAPELVSAAGAGGLSGEPLRARSRAVLGLLRARVDDTMTLVSVGGISTAADVQERLAGGATLVQAYTAFIYEGPAWPSRVQRQLAGTRTPG